VGDGVTLDVLLIYLVTGFMAAWGIWRGAEVVIAVARRLRDRPRPLPKYERQNRWQEEQQALAEWQQTFNKTAGVEEPYHAVPAREAPSYEDYPFLARPTYVPPDAVVETADARYARRMASSNSAFGDYYLQNYSATFYTLNELRRRLDDTYQGKA
jgi:hypothetical protein